MRCLILGGNGFIGSHLVDKLLYEGHEVRVFDKYPENFRSSNSRVDYRFGDFSNRALVTQSLEGIDIVFHLINTTLPKSSNDDPLFDVQSNVIESICLFRQCVGNVKKIVYVSSGGTVYGNAKVLPIDEDSPTNPECSYGIVKLATEKYLALYSHLYGLDYVILRPSNPYGSRQNPNGIQGVISVFLGKLLNKHNIEIWGDGEIVRDYIYISDLIEGIYAASTISTKSKIFNLGSGQGISLNYLIEVIKNITGESVPVEYKSGRRLDIAENYLDIKRAKEELAWKPEISLHNGIDNTWQFIRSLKNET